ncbi:MAG: sugar ABC transporter permease [Caldilineaceae bacterium SB0668_bin_21]|nr:sugar ABC transporter permease [Caldilineaceae bacterium SB0668_bin_21]MYC20735.1 sugar ABC transporter permease [Caldilineaceae bacterium SB0662_bin_25]
MTASASSQSSLPRWRRYQPDQQWEAYLFLLPSFAGFLIFVAIPVVASLALSLFEWSLLSPPEFVGTKNYTQLLSSDLVFRKVLSNTFYFIVTIVPLQLAFGLLLAVALNQGLRGLEVYRLIYFMPVVTTIVAAALVFQWFFNRDFGILAAAVWELGAATGLPIRPPDWLNDPDWAKPAVVILTLWKNTGFTMVIYLAALQGVPTELYDAAKVDGASAWQRFRSVTFPMVSPTTFFLMVIQMIGAFQLFSEAFVMTQGGPANATLTIVYYIYQMAFEFQRMGRGAAIAWVLFIFIFIFTLVQTRLQRRWVHYEAGGES